MDIGRMGHDALEFVQAHDERVFMKMNVRTIFGLATVAGLLAAAAPADRGAGAVADESGYEFVREAGIRAHDDGGPLAPSSPPPLASPPRLGAAITAGAITMAGGIITAITGYVKASITMRFDQN